jgi:hypothetical protein
VIPLSLRSGPAARLSLRGNRRGDLIRVIRGNIERHNLRITSPESNRMANVARHIQIQVPFTRNRNIPRAIHSQPLTVRMTVRMTGLSPMHSGSWDSAAVSIRIMDQDRDAARQYLVRVVGDPSLPAFMQVNGGLALR